MSCVKEKFDSFNKESFMSSVNDLNFLRKSFEMVINKDSYIDVE